MRGHFEESRNDAMTRNLEGVSCFWQKLLAAADGRGFTKENSRGRDEREKRY